MKVISYEQARNVISDGDLVFFKNGPTIWSKATKIGTGFSEYHCGIAFWVRDARYKSRLFIVEAHQGGRRIVSLSSYQKFEFDVIASPLDWEMHCDPVLDGCGVIPYSYVEYAWIGALELCGIKRRGEDDYGEVCSKMVANYCKAGGIDVGNTDISPGKLKQTLLERGCELKAIVSNKV